MSPHGEREAKAVVAHSDEESAEDPGSQQALGLPSSDGGMEPAWGGVVRWGTEQGDLRFLKPPQYPVREGRGGGRRS